VPPNGQGVAGLIDLSGLQHLEEKNACPIISPETIGSADAHHAMVEMIWLGFADARAHVACPESIQVENDWSVDHLRIGQRAERLFDNHHNGIQGMPDAGSCTVSFQVVDNEGNAISFMNCNYHGFRAGLVPDKCGFSLQNRGAGFSLQPGHANVVAPSKRPYHTIIPGMLGVAPLVVVTAQTTTATVTAVSTDYEGRESDVIWSHDLDDKVRIRSQGKFVVNDGSLEVYSCSILWSRQHVAKQIQ
jgi:gamma-glutamyltranspeptidase